MVRVEPGTCFALQLEFKFNTKQQSNGESLTVQVEKEIKNIKRSELLLLFYFFHKHKADSLQHLK